jgi:hypothetical protein
LPAKKSAASHPANIAPDICPLPVADASEPAAALLARLRAGRFRAALITEQGCLVGILFAKTLYRKLLVG